MTKREFLRHILEVKGRYRRGSSPLALLMLQSLQNEYRAVDSSLDEKVHDIARYVPVALIAHLEVLTRGLIAELIDRGTPYLQRSEELTRQMKFEFPVILGLHGRQITIGEFISHSLPVSNLDHINRPLSILINDSLLDRLRTVQQRWESHPILTNPNDVYAQVTEAFRLRHILCHELSWGLDVTRGTLAMLSKAVLDFAEATWYLVASVLSPDFPMTQTEMNIAAGRRLREADERLAALIRRIDDVQGPERATALGAAQASWRAFRDAEATFRADQYRGGTIWSTIYSGIAEHATQDRIDELERYYEDLKEQSQ